MFVILQTHPSRGCFRGSVYQNTTRPINSLISRGGPTDQQNSRIKWDMIGCRRGHETSVNDRQSSSPAHRCSLIGSNCPNWVHVSSPCLPPVRLSISLSAWRCVHISGASKMISSFRPASKPLSKPWLSVC